MSRVLNRHSNGTSAFPVPGTVGWADDAVLVDSGDGNWVFPVYAEIGGGGLITGEFVIPKAPPVAGQGTPVPDVTGGIEWVRLPKSNENYPILRSGFVIHFEVVGTKN